LAELNLSLLQMLQPKGWIAKNTHTNAKIQNTQNTQM